MNIKFETINGQLCRMVEQPCPHCNQPEIIATHVADGSAEWMIYHAMHGKLFVTKEKPLLYYSASKEGMVRGRVIEGDLVVEIYNPETFIEKLPTGWQIYEPEPLLADAKVGDLCKTDLDEWIQIDDTSEPPNPILYHFDRPFNGNIIHTEPLAPEGTDKWAWQMMLLGKKVCQKHNSYFPNKRYYAIKDGNDYCAFYENNGNEVNITNTRRTYDEFIEYCKFTPQYNWQLYTEPQTEPCEICAGIGMISCEACNATGRVPIKQEPRPAYAVGDWVEFIDAGGNKSHGKYLSNAYDNTIIVLDIIYNMRCVVPTTKITRKLQTSEVVVDFGNGIRGTIEASMPQTWIHVRRELDWKIIATLYVPNLDEPIQTLVKDLLEKQEEK